MKQYKQIKQDYPDKILFFRLGDFYEMFDEDAVEVSALLNLTLTHKGDSPMCGIPYHAVKNYLKRLLDAGKKIAICEQMSLSDSPKALARREVVRIVTPATVVEEDFLTDTDSSYILSVFQRYCAFCEVSTGEFRLRELGKENRIASLRAIIEQIRPKELLVCEDEYFLDSDFKEAVDLSPAMITKLPPWYFSTSASYKLLCEQAGVSSLAAFGIDEKNRIAGPAGALLRYIRETSKSPVDHITNYTLDVESSYVSIDESSRKNLELFRNLYDGSSSNTLFETINRCRTNSGTRLLKNFLNFPLHDKSAIEDRQKRVKYFYDNSSELERVRSLISGSRDLNRLMTRIILKRAVPRDLTGIKQSIGTFFSIVSEDPQRYSELFDSVLTDNTNLEKAYSLMQEIDRAVNEDFLGQFNAGEVIKDGYDSILDEKRTLMENGNSVLSSYLEEEKSESGLSILKLGYNRVYGYYLEIPKGQVSRAPQYFIRIQTLVNGERFTTEKLKEFEREINLASAEAENRERELYNNLLASVQDISSTLNAMGSFMSLLDVYQALATLAVDSEYVCPQITEEDVLEIRGGRHPVVEKHLGSGKFVSNDLDMSVRFCLITGPNMAGKSTYLRQNALIILLSHIGSFVPATSAVIGLTDRIFCRVGAMDNLARGESTFLVEMQETSYILRNCTDRSFVIVDEVGRGTSTQDGMSLAYAIMKDLIAKNAKTLFATHYHELTMMDISGIRLLTPAVEDSGKSVVFLRKMIEGAASSSYGIHVARLAGVPYQVIREAKSFQNRHFADYGVNKGQSSLFSSSDESIVEEETLPSSAADIIKELQECNPEQMTPVQALILLSKLKEEAQ
ncbi:MAG: DNA mismatch repair protein MutS [Sphaerochaetaceae bacterium]|nr:DNA mismatch repair protein MutS [Sphaerochaetaceae bacterium]